MGAALSLDLFGTAPTVPASVPPRGANRARGSSALTTPDSSNVVGFSTTQGTSSLAHNMPAMEIGMQEIRSARPEMPSAEAYANDLREWITDSASVRQGPRKAVLAQIARETGIGCRRIVALFYGEVRHPYAAEYEQIKRWHAYETQRRLERGDAEMRMLRARLAEMQADAR